MKPQTVIFCFVFCVVLTLSACTSFPLTLFPTPTWTPWPTDTPTPDYRATVAKGNAEVIERADEIAHSLAGNKAIDCGDIKSDKHIINPSRTEYVVNDCVTDAIRATQAFFAHGIDPAEDFYQAFWLIGAPDGKIFVVYYEVGWQGPYGPETRVCENPGTEEYKVLICRE